MLESSSNNLRIDCVLAPQVNFACHQNSVPLIRDLSLTNAAEEAVADLTLELTASPAFVPTKTWTIDRIPAGGTTHITDRDTRLDGQFLLGLGEVMRGMVTLTLRQGEQILATHHHDLEVLARNEWGGYGASPELLAAFVMPNDSAVEKVLHAASTTLRRAGLEPNIDGYRTHSRKRVWEQVSAIWSAISGLNLDYAYPPASFEKTGQKVRTPSMIVETRRATCLDTTLLFCAALEQAGLHGVIVIKQGHAYAGVWLQPEGFGEVLTDDVVAVRKRVDLKELLLFETTLVTQTPAVAFSEGSRQGRHQVGEGEGEDFEYLLDLSRARAKRILPLDYVSETHPKGPGVPADEPKPMDSAPPDLPNFRPEDPDAKPTSPAGRLAQWQRKLLDLTLRNPLLNFQARKASVSLIAPDPAALEDRLADGAEMQILALPEFGSAGGRDPVIHEQRTGERLEDEYAKEGLQHNLIYVRMDRKRLEESLVALYRQAKSSLEEGGANTLFLAIGFLRWQREDKADRVFRAPLILVPIQISRQSVRSGIKIKLHDDEPRFNTTLLEMLRHDCGLDISGLDGALPEDESGIDVTGIWNKIRQEVRDVEGYEVTEEVVLGTFSFAKYLMWKDLVDRTKQLKENRVVRHLLDTPKDPFATDLRFPDTTTLDENHAPVAIFTPLDTDSSQLAAVLASAQGKDFVMIGPPGTGKSQTIANMIAQNLANDRTVLFVSEKAAALSVVYRRLKMVGLGEFCLELHSNKAQKAEVLQQLRYAWEAREEFSKEIWEKKAEELRLARDDLNRYVQRLHQAHRNGWSIHRALAQIVANPDVPEVAFDWPSADTHDSETFARLLEVARRININAKEIGNIADHPLGVVSTSDWSLAWQQDLLEAGRRLATAAGDFRRSIGSLSSTLSMDMAGLSAGQVESILRLCEALKAAEGQSLGFAFSGRAKAILKAAEESMDLLAEYRQVEQGLSCRYADQAWRELELDSLTDTWAEAGKRWWPNSAMMRRSVRKNLKWTGQAQGKPAPEQDLPVLAQLAGVGEQIDDRDEALREIADWRGFETDLPSLKRSVEIARQLGESTAGLAHTPEQLVELRKKVKALVVEGNDMLGGDGAVGITIADILEHAARFQERVEAFTGLAGDQIGNRETAKEGYLEAIKALCEKLDGHKAQLNAWCAWRRAQKDAVDCGMGPLTDALENGFVAADDAERAFLVAYCRWWVTKALDSDDVLRHFVPAEHEARIEDFKQLDAHLQRLSTQYVRARLCGQLPHQDEVQHNSEFGVLKRELEKRRKHKPLRQLVTELPTALPQLTPCLLMSPLSIAQYLPVDHEQFDVVIFDEASQITVYDAIGAIARGKQTIVAGDPKQLPPTNFFARQAEEEDLGDQEPDLESILDEMLAANVPELYLNWHYRSQNENLITFSNHRYYGGRLITFPAAKTSDDSVKFQFVAGTYERGGGRTNRAEADAIVKEIITRLRGTGSIDMDGNDTTPTLGVVTFNSEQQTLIENLLDEARRQYPDIEPHFGENVLEPVFVKNLENVQGDERDVILFSVTYGPDRAGKFSMNFGPLNKEGGERRLNVAVSRARQEMVVFSSIRGDQIDLSRTQALGATDLKHFLEFAERGPKALSEAIFGPQGDFDSPFESAVARELRQHGWQLHLQVGVSAFRIDLGVVHPDFPGRYLAGVECDGATYHRAATARDRDKVREGILRHLGWSIVRVWSTDFWLNPKGAIEKLDRSLSALLEEDRERMAQSQDPVGDGDTEPAVEDASPGESIEDEVPIAMEDGPVWTSDGPQEKVPWSQVADPPQPKPAPRKSARLAYRIVRPEDIAFPLNSEAFYDSDYTQTLDQLIDLIVRAEGPILDENLVKRVANMHGFRRAGSRINDRVLRRAHRKWSSNRESVGEFFWPPGTDPGSLEGCRLPVTREDFRPPNQVPMEELIALADEFQWDEDPPLAMARELGIARLSSQHRARLKLALEKVGT